MSKYIILSISVITVISNIYIDNIALAIIAVSGFLGLFVSLTYENISESANKLNNKIIELNNYRNDLTKDLETIANAVNEINIYMNINNSEFSNYLKGKK